ncbi:MAG TPA: hypothetical protein VFI31_20725 [Pirellulales bacterium]|nr:hypothetical protein [Pirellulales bacterium]
MTSSQFWRHAVGGGHHFFVTNVSVICRWLGIAHHLTPSPIRRQEAEIPTKESTGLRQGYRLRHICDLVDNAIAILANLVRIGQPVAWHLGSCRERVEQVGGLWFCRSFFYLDPCFPKTGFENSEQPDEVGGLTISFHVIGIATFQPSGGQRRRVVL